MKKSIALIMAVLVLMTTLFSNAVFAANEPAFVANNVTGKAGDTVQITVSTVNNPGIMGLKIYVGYDEKVLELVSATAGTSFSDTSFGSTDENPFNMLWDGSLAGSVNVGANNTANDVIATLTFKILDTAATGKSDITLTYPSGWVYDNNWEDVDFATVAGSVTVESDDVDLSTALSNKGANIRLESDEMKAGLRFASTISKAELGIVGDYTYSADADVAFGMFMLPKSLLKDSGYATIKELYESGKQNQILDAVAKRIWQQDEATLTYTAVLTDIPEDNWVSTICAVPYVLKNGKYYFGAQMEKSYYDVAKAARNSTYSDKEIAKITDATEKANAKAIADKLQKILDTVDDQGWIDGWY